MKDVIIVANFAQGPGEISNDRFAYIANLIKDDCNVELITSSFHHKNKKQREKHSETVNKNFTITTVYEPGYPKNICLQRFYSHWVWGRNLKKYLKSRKKPDVIYCAVPSLTGPLEAAKYCQKNGVKFIVDVQDLWPEAFKMVFNIPIVSDIIFAPFNWLANGIYKRADEVVAVSDTYVNRALSVNKKCNSGHTVFLGTRLETFDVCANGEAMLKKPDGKVWIGYCGSLAASYDIPNLIYAVKRLNNKGINDIKLIVMGDGAYRQEFEDLAVVEGVDAVFTGTLPYNDMCAQLKECDIVVNPIKSGSAASIINKHGDYAASGLPVVNSQDSPEYRKLVEEYNMGLNCNNEDPEDMADKLEQLILNKDMRLEMGKNARRCAEEKFDRKNSYKEILDTIIK